MLLATIGAFCIGEYPEGVAVMLFYSVGERVQHRAVDRARRNIRRLLDVRPEKALVLRQGKEQSVFPGEVEVGEMIMVNPENGFRSMDCYRKNMLFSIPLP